MSCPSSQRRYVHEAGAESDRCVPDSCGTNTIAAVAAGGEHACLVRKGDGALWCWGRNDDGQLGDGTRTPRALAVRVPNVTATAVAAGQRHTCVVRGGGGVACWGADDTGQLGDGGGAVDKLTPVAVALPMPAVAVAAGNDFSCALLADRTVRCWGDDSVGQLGDDGAAAVSLRPSAVAGLDGVVQMSAFWQHACAARGDGTIACWGANSQGQLGDGTTTNRAHPVAVATLASAVVVGTGVTHTCAIAAPGALLCWGSNAYGQLGNGATSSTPVTAPGLVSTVTGPRALAVGAQHTCAAQSDGTMLCWGQNGSGQLARGAIESLAAPVPVPDWSVGTAIAAGNGFSCAVTRDGAVFCWGDDSYGQLGVGSGAIRTSPAEVPGVAGAISIAAGGAHTCVATGGAAVGAPAGGSLCWGADQAGQLGDGVTDDRARPGPLTVDIGATAFGAGDAHTCAVTAGAGLYCWGRGNAGQLGLGPTKQFDWHQPFAVTISGAATAVAGGARHTCAIVDGTVQCFGANEHGQLGDGTTTDRSAPPTAGAGVAGPVAPVTAVATGGAHTCAIDAGGQVWCWGEGDEGATGGGAGPDLLAPVMVPLGGGAPAAAIAAGRAHTCAVIAGGAVSCWGRGSEGQLGSGDTPEAAGPTLVAGVTAAVDVAAVAAGSAHSCVIGAGGTVLCWGANDDGQLGDGTTAASPTPVPVPGIKGAKAVAAGGAHTCASLATGAVACWGADTSGQLGDGVVLSEPTPALARIACD